MHSITLLVIGAIGGYIAGTVITLAILDAIELFRPHTKGERHD